MRTRLAHRLSLSARLGLIVTVGFLAAWLSFVALFYRFSAETALLVAPPADKLLAMARLIETLPAEARGQALVAFETPRLSVSVAREPPPPERPRLVRDFLEEIEARLEERMAGRDVAVGSPRAAVIGVPVRRLLGRTPAELEIQVGLSIGETLVVAADTPYATLASPIPVGIGAGILGTLIAVAALIVMHRETRPLAKLAAILDRLDLTGRAPPIAAPGWTAPEIRAVIVAVNRLQDRLSGLLTARLALIGGLSHDVRTFATRLRLKLDGIADETERARAARDIDDMIHLLDDALIAARSGAGDVARELVEVDEVVAAEVDSRGIEGGAVRFAAPPAGTPTTVLGDRLALRRIVANLVDNALKYGDSATVSVMAERDVVRLIVDDDGPGIAATDRAAVLEPFVRLEGSRNRGTGGAGLGLAVVRAFAEGMGGAVAVETAPQGGARLVVTLPLFRAEA